MQHRLLLRTVPLAALCILSLAHPERAVAQDSDLQNRIQRLERDIQDMQREVYRRNGQTPPANGLAPPPPVQDTTSSQRVDDIEQSLIRLTGQLEELGHRIDQLDQRVDRMQKDMDYRLSNAAPNPPSESGDQSAPDEQADSAAGNAPRPLAPATGSLGTLRADEVPPPAGNAQEPPRQSKNQAVPPKSAQSPQAQYDAAMNQLAAGQYDAASQAFRSFADAHPDDELAPQALFWTGDIAYSAKKDYPGAARSFAELLKKFDKSSKAPDAMLKLGLSLVSMGQKDQGCATLAALPAKYPKAPAAIATQARNERRAKHC